ncbi:MAG: U32 family peptidase [Paludibacteraceae bacterium]|nr:U32 family peptidase [Paludibacteraceae bacterium]
MKHPFTILAPAKNLAVGQSAIQAGADAVYIGAPKFGARQAAGNSIADIAQLVQDAHRYGVQVLITLNTLLTDAEKVEAVAIANDLYRIGVDALIIQDLSLLNCSLPPIRLHASTQCDNRTAEQVLHLRDLGFKRVVLARELSIDEIRHIHDIVGDSIELEAFVHGALCVCYSGKCYMSEALMNRSANRGCCAQMCRQKYDLLDADMREVVDDNGTPVHQRYLLSLQDMDRSIYLREMIDAGITTFKIEGRLKDADYVTNIVAYYRQKMDAILSSLDMPPSTRYTYSFTPNPEKTFHRGATDYFLHGRTRPMANWDTPKSTGELVTPHTQLHSGDGLCFEDRGFYVNAIQGGRIIPNKPIHIPAGTPLYRNFDIEFQRSLHAERRILTDILFEETPDGFRLTYTPCLAGHPAVSADFAYAKQPADNPERALTVMQQQLSKLGDTIYAVRHIQINSKPYFIPISQLNQWRRNLLEHL